MRLLLFFLPAVLSPAFGESGPRPFQALNKAADFSNQIGIKQPPKRFPGKAALRNERGAAGRQNASGFQSAAAAGAAGAPPPTGALPGSPQPEGRLLKGKAPRELSAFALFHLRRGETEKALPALQRLFYQHGFLPSYSLMKAWGAPPSLFPLMWHLSAFAFGVFSLLILMRLIRKKPFSGLDADKKISWRLPFLWLSALSLLALSGFFALRPRASAAGKAKILAAPFEEALPLLELSAGAELLILGKKEGWRKARAAPARGKNRQPATGWILKERLFPILE